MANALLLHFRQDLAELAHSSDKSIYGDARFVVCMASMKAAAAVFLVIAIIASTAFALDPNNSPYGYAPKILPASATSTDSSTGLTLGLSLNATTIRSGQTVNFSASEYNTLPTMDNVTAANDWPLHGLSLGLCGMVNEPFGMVVFRGYYAKSNVTSASPLMLYQLNAMTSCPAIFSVISRYSFYPGSSKAQIWGSCDPEPCQADDLSGPPISASNQINGFWSTIPYLQWSYPSALPSGVYTVAAGDEWGQLVLLHFVVNR